MNKSFTVPVYNIQVFINSDLDNIERFAQVSSGPTTLSYDPKQWNLRTLAHECIHIMNFVLADIGQGMPIKDLSGYYDDEYCAYLYADIFQNVLTLTKKDLKEFKKHKKGVKSK